MVDDSKQWSKQIISYCAIPFPAKVAEPNIVKIKGHNFTGVYPSPVFMKLVARKCIILSCLFIKLKNKVFSCFIDFSLLFKTNGWQLKAKMQFSII